MASFKDFYRTVFQTFGYPLTASTALPAGVIATAEKRLGVRVPAALRDYYAVAGRERRFSKCFDRLLRPTKWEVDQQQLVFMEENQSVCWWGVSTRNPKTKDPPVSQGVPDDPIQWDPEHRRCSMFLAVILHYQAVSGGFRYCGSAQAPDQSSYRFDENGWRFYGEMNSLLAYSRPNQVVCLMKPSNLPFAQKWSVLAGGKSKGDLQAIAVDVGVSLDSCRGSMHDHL